MKKTTVIWESFLSYWYSAVKTVRKRVTLLKKKNLEGKTKINWLNILKQSKERLNFTNCIAQTKKEKKLSQEMIDWFLKQETKWT